MRISAGVGLMAALGVGMMAQNAFAVGVGVSAKVCDARTYGAKADGVTKDTKAIQAAIDDCTKAKGGGTVTLSGGTFLSAPIVLKDNVTLDLATGSTLLGSADHDDYPQMEVFRAPGRQSLVSADHAKNIAITGGGVIDGNGQSWWTQARATPGAGIVGVGVFRPRLVVFNYCQHIRMEGVTVQNSPSWQIVPYYSDDIVIRNIKVLAPYPSPNTDAIDPFSSSNIVIDHVYADTGDDNIAIKSGEINSPGPDSPSKNITITDCNFDHGHGISIGSEIAGGAQNIHAERIHFKGTDNGIRIKSARDRGNDVSNISYKDITMENVKIAISISEYYPHAAPEGEVPAEPVGRLTPKFHDISIENVTATGSGTAGTIVGLPESPVLGLTMKNVHIAAKTGMSIAYATVAMDDVVVTPVTGDAMKIASTAKVTIKK
jgi:polygalacturonase